MEDHQLYEEQEYESGDPVQGVIHNDVKHAQIEELLENGENNKNSCDSSILQSGNYEVKFKLEFLNNILSPNCHIFDDLNTTPSYQLPKIVDCSVKSRKCVKIKGKKDFISLIFLTSNNFESKKKRVSRFGRTASFLKKPTKNVHVCGMLLIPYLVTNNEFLILFNPLEIQADKKKLGLRNGIW